MAKARPARNVEHGLNLDKEISANEILLNVEITKLVIFKSPRKVLSDETKKNLKEKGYIHQTLKFIGVRIGRFLHWHD